jgi:hypothetical protein
VSRMCPASGVHSDSRTKAGHLAVDVLPGPPQSGHRTRGPLTISEARSPPHPSRKGGGTRMNESPVKPGWFSGASPGAPLALRDAQLGAISFPQRFGSSLNPHYHYHVLALDGVVSGDVEHGVRFHEANGLEAREAEAIARTVQLRVLRWFARRGLLDPFYCGGHAHVAGDRRVLSAPPARRTRPSPTAHRTIPRAPIPMAPRPPPLRPLSGASRAHGRPRHPRLFGSLHGRTPRPSLPPPPERAFETPIHSQRGVAFGPDPPKRRRDDPTNHLISLLPTMIL